MEHDKAAGAAARQESMETERRAAMLQRVQANVQTAKAHVARLKRTNRRLLYTSILASTLATAVAGLAAAFGMPEGAAPSAWRLTCGGVAVLTAVAGIFSGVHQRFNITENMAKAVACVGRLRALELALTVTHRDPVEVAREYEEVAAAYQDFLV